MAFCMLLGTLSVISALPVFAAEETETPQGPINATDFFTQGFASKEEKFDSMNVMASRYDYELRVEPLTGEVAIKNTKTGDILTTNPYDVGNFKADDSIKKKLLSQVAVNFESVDGTIKAKDLYSFEYAAELNQIKVKPIKNGARVEYVIGKQESRYLFPDQIEKERFEKEILAMIPYDEDTYDAATATYEEKQAYAHYRRIKASYLLKDPTAEGTPESVIKSMLIAYPVLDKTSDIGKSSPNVKALYVFDSKASMKLKNEIEYIIKLYCPNYTYEDREYDHELCKYEEKRENPVQFRVALEYYIEETGLRVRIPANGIRFDQSTYRLNKIICLPYMGAANSNYTGYTMFPDGSGTLTRFEDVKANGQSFTLYASAYGQDHVYRNEAKMIKNAMPMRMPVFGVVEDTQYTVTDEASGESSTSIRKSGYFAIIEEGEALATLRTTHGEKGHHYYSTSIEFDSVPTDSFSLSSIVSVGGDGGITKTLDRRYTGNFTIRYIMLTDLEYCAKNGIDTTGCYDTSYLGMALAYRQRLISTGALVDEKVEAGDIPLYIESLGAMDVQEKVLSIPVTVKKALTTFDDVKKIHKELGDEGINNIVFKLTGFMNGGLKNTVANQIDVEKVVGGNKGLKNLQKYAKEKNFEIYLNADFSYTYKDAMFDGFSREDEALRAIDGRFVQKQAYDAVLQKFTSTGLLVIAPSSFESIFGKLNKDAKALNLEGLALGSLGSDLSSDFDEDDPYNREDSKQQVINTLNKVRKAGYDLMVDGGNAYAVGYAKHILNIPLVSSRRAQASEAIPFFALVYHGYLNYAGSATNMAGDMRYEMLKIIENGANPYFILVYRNSEKLKQDKELSKYFAISYQNWKEDLVEAYNDLNAVLSPVKTSTIVYHGFLTGMRVPTAEELAADKLEKEQADKEQADKEQIDKEAAEKEEQLKDHLGNNYIKNDTETEAPELNTSTTTVSKYLVDNGMIVKMTFENGYSFILNYNYYDVTVEELGDTVIEQLGYVVLNADGEIVINSGEEAAA